jgi:uncharacterized protein (TIGR02757 family)
MPVQVTRRLLENLYKKYNRRVFVSPDPLQFLYDYDNIRDREIVGLIASALAYGRVNQILKSIKLVLERLSPSPSEFLKVNSLRAMKKTFADFKHRFTTGEQLSLLLFSVKNIISKHGSLYECFKSSVNSNDRTIVPALAAFVYTLRKEARGLESHILPSPGNGSACKRLNLFLRWMIRKDQVDPGGWDRVHPSKLIIPLDTHMYKIGYTLGFTQRKQADLKGALEITEGFRRFSPEDPVKYDFALTRFGIRDDFDLQTMLTAMHGIKAEKPKNN